MLRNKNALEALTLITKEVITDLNTTNIKQLKSDI